MYSVEPSSEANAEDETGAEDALQAEFRVGSSIVSLEIVEFLGGEGEGGRWCGGAREGQGSFARDEAAGH